MFKKFGLQSSKTQLKSSSQRQLIKRMEEQWQGVQLDPKTPIFQQKQLDYTVYIQSDQVLCVEFEDVLIPNLKLLLSQPEILPKIQVDQGAIKFLLRGSDVMCPGLTSPGALMEQPLEKGRLVQIRCEGKVHPVGIGRLLMSTDEIREINKGVGVQLFHYLGDELYHLL
ncbi:PUA-like domain-containing protein, partial [Gorgonomyces haynaldii]